MIDVRKNHRELMTDSKRTRDSAMRFYDKRLVRSEIDELVTHLVLLFEQDLVVF